MLPGNIGYISIKNFNNNCAKQTIEAIESLTQQGATALVFDVRNNGGGYVHEMIQVLDYLLPEGVLFRSVSYNGKEEVDTSDSRCLELPMAVLVNAYSYSCAEFFAAALREYDWATVVGEATVGKGYFQNVYRFADGSALGLSTGQYYTPNGVSLAQEGGLTPDVAVEVDELTFAMIYAKVLPLEEDPQLNAALEALE
jgi:carboxyl-terminal processing protease